MHSPSSRGWWPTAAELREPHRVARYLEDTTAIFNKWYDTRECRMLPKGDEPVAPINEARLVLTVAARTVLANGLAPARRLRPGADVRAHEAGWAHAAVSVRGPAWLREPGDVNALVPELWSQTARKVDGVLEVGGVRLTDLVERARLAGVRPRRGRLPRPCPRLPRRVRGLRRLLRRQGVPLYDGRAMDRRGGAQPRRLLRR